MGSEHWSSALWADRPLRRAGTLVLVERPQPQVLLVGRDVGVHNIPIEGDGQALMRFIAYLRGEPVEASDQLRQCQPVREFECGCYEGSCGELHREACTKMHVDLADD